MLWRPVDQERNVSIFIDVAFCCEALPCLAVSPCAALLRLAHDVL